MNKKKIISLLLFIGVFLILNLFLIKSGFPVIAQYPPCPTECTCRTLNACISIGDEPMEGYDCGDQICCCPKSSNGEETESEYPPDGAENVPIPVTLDWPDVENAKSYYVRIFKGGEIWYEKFITEEDPPTSKIVFDPDEFRIFSASTTYEWEVATCFNQDLTQCGVSCGEEQSFAECAEFGPRWSFTTEKKEVTPPELTAPPYSSGPPEEIPVVNMHDYLKWSVTEEVGWWANSFSYEIKKDDKIVVGPNNTMSQQVLLGDVWKALFLATKYSWHVRSCLGENNTDCGQYSETWYFITTGAIPTNISSTETIPVKLDWDDVAGAASFEYQVFSDPDFNNLVDKGLVQKSEAIVEYPKIKPDTKYWWRVRTCANKEGLPCGDWSSTQKFRTQSLGVPSNPSPENNDYIYYYQSQNSWQAVPGTNFYQYTLVYVSRSSYESSENCTENQVIRDLTITPSNFFSIILKCFGLYSWQVRACLDENCTNSGDWGGPWQFHYAKSTATDSAKGGIIPCSRYSDNPGTPWDERDPCEIKHIFLLIKNILDLLLWRIGLIILVFLIIATFAVSYFSFGGPDIGAKIKSIWKSAGQGYAIVFLAWMIVNFILNTLGFKGIWWTFSF